MGLPFLDLLVYLLKINSKLLSASGLKLGNFLPTLTVSRAYAFVEFLDLLCVGFLDL